MPMCAREELDCPVEKLKEKIVQLEKEKVELLDKCMSLDYGKSRAESWLQDTLREKALLEREVDWFAGMLRNDLKCCYGNVLCHNDPNRAFPATCIKCWRETSRRGVSSD